jgi:hypothetical protein
MQVPGVIGSVGHQQHSSNSNQMTRGCGVVNSIEGLGVGSNRLVSLVVGGWWCMGGESSGMKLQKRMDLVALNKLSFKFIFLNYRLQTVRTFFKICSCVFPAKVVLSFGLTDRELS